MKKFLCALLAAVLMVSTFGVAALAEGEDAIVVDGVKDAKYNDDMMLDYMNWVCFSDNTNSTEPVDPERIKNTVWFYWDDASVYLYFQCESKDPLYKPAEGEEMPTDRELTYFEQANVYLDTIPSAEYYAPCQKPSDPEDPYCNHFHCNANAAGESGEEESKYYRLMARVSPAFEKWNNYYRADEGMFMTYDEFVAFRCDTSSRGYDARYVADPMSWYTKENGGKGAAASFIDYETNTYGFELKYPRAEAEEYFQFNVVNDAQAWDWEEEGPELPYTLSFAPAWWMNADGLLEIFYEDYQEIVDAIEEGTYTGNVDPAVNAFRRLKEQLPAVDSLTLEHKAAVNELVAAYNALSEESATNLTDEEHTYVMEAAIKVALLEYVANLGEINKDGKINANDALIVLRAAVGKVELDEDSTLRADVNADEKLDAKDALEILKFAVGKITEFPAARAVEL